MADLPLLLFRVSTTCIWAGPQISSLEANPNPNPLKPLNRWMADFLDLVLLGFVKSDVVKDFGISKHGEGWMLGVSLGTSGLGGIVAGFLADRIGKRDILASTILMYSIGSLIAGACLFAFGRFTTNLRQNISWCPAP